MKQELSNKKYKNYWTGIRSSKESENRLTNNVNL